MTFIAILLSPITSALRIAAYKEHGPYVLERHVIAIRDISLSNQLDDIGSTREEVY